MMLDPSIDELQEKIRSKYTLVTLSARRAREIGQKNNCLIANPRSEKELGMALEEVIAGKLSVKKDVQKEAE